MAALLSSVAAAQFLGVSTDYLRKLSREQKVAHFRSAHGGTHSRFLYNEDDLKAYLATRGGTRRVEAKKVAK